MEYIRDLLSKNDMNADVIQAQHEFGIIGTCPQLLQAISAAVQAAPYDVNVLILGENGVGKEDFHKILHRYSLRSSKKCIAINCGALPEGTINSELFGHMKGSFTGAIADHAGYFEVANGGTIFLDEVGELPLDTQARLLRVLESGEFQRMGSSEVKKTDVRIVAATNRDLLKAIGQGKFREDLYYRLSTITIRVPPLRVRGKDIYLLFRKFASDFTSRYRKERITLTPEAQRALEAYTWPGNVRQLRHLVRKSCGSTSPRSRRASRWATTTSTTTTRSSPAKRHSSTSCSSTCRTSSTRCASIWGWPMLRSRPPLPATASWLRPMQLSRPPTTRHRPMTWKNRRPSRSRWTSPPHWAEKGHRPQNR